MNRWRWWLPVFVSLILILAGCVTQTTPQATEAEQPGQAAEEPAQAAEEPVAEEKATVTFWFDPPGGGEEADCFVETVVNPFNEQNNTVFVDAVPQPDTWNATRTAIAGGAGPDIIVTPGPSFVFELAQAGQLLALDDFVDQFGWSEVFVPWALSLGQVEGSLYSVPHELETLVLYYNKTLFEEKGWEPPTTVDEMMALAEEIAAEDIIPFAHANADWRPANEWFAGEFLNHVAGPEKVYEALTGQISWTDPDFVDAIELLNQAQQNDWFMGGLDLYYTTGWDDFHAAFGSGEAAMNIEGTWIAADLDANFFTEENGGNEWDWVPMPSVSGQAIFDVGMGSTWSVNKNAENPQAAAEFLTHFFSPAVQAQLLRDCGTAPAPVRLEADALEGVDPRIAGIFAALAKASDANNYGYTTWTFWPPKSDVYIYEEIEKVWAGEMTSEEYLQGLQEVFTEELEAGDIPPIPTR